MKALKTKLTAARDRYNETRFAHYVGHKVHTGHNVAYLFYFAFVGIEGFGKLYAGVAAVMFAINFYNWITGAEA